jgi:Tol biopolymer transport system component
MFGDIYLYNSSNSSLVNITQNIVDTLHYAYTSSFSEDGHKLLFTLDYRKIGNGDLLFCDRDDVFSYDLTAGTVERITNNEFRETHPTCSKDGGNILYESYEGGNSDIYVIDSLGNRKRLLAPNSSYEHYPKFIMNDRNILYVSNRDSSTECYLTNLNGDLEERLTFDGPVKSNPSISSDNRFLVYAANGLSPVNLDAWVFKYDFVTGTSVQLLSDSIRNGMNLSPKISNDSKHIVFLHSDGIWTYAYLMDSDGKNVVNIGKGYLAEFTKDSKYVISIGGGGLHRYDIEFKKDSILLPYTSLGFNLAVSSID